MRWGEKECKFKIKWCRTIKTSNSDIKLTNCGQIQQLQEPLSIKEALSFKFSENFSVFQLYKLPLQMSGLGRLEYDLFILKDNHGCSPQRRWKWPLFSSMLLSYSSQSPHISGLIWNILTLSPATPRCPTWPSSPCVCRSVSQVMRSKCSQFTATDALLTLGPSSPGEPGAPVGPCSPWEEKEKEIKHIVCFHRFMVKGIKYNIGESISPLISPTAP